MYRLKVKEVAAARGMSQRQIIKRSGLDTRLVQKVLRHEDANITLRTLDTLAVTLGVDVRELLESVPESGEIP